MMGTKKPQRFVGACIESVGFGNFMTQHYMPLNWCYPLPG